MVPEEAAAPAPLEPDALEETASVIVDVQVLNVDLTDVEPLAENVYQDKLVSQDSVPEPVPHNVQETMEPSELVDGIDAEAAVVDAQKVSDAVTEPVNVIPTVRTNTVDLMAVEENVELVKERVLSAKVQLMPSLNNVILTATSK